SSSSRPCNVECTADERGTLAHAEQSDRSWVTGLGIRDAPAVVPNAEFESTSTPRKRDHDGAGVRVANDIRQRFLQNAEDGDLLLGRETGWLILGIDSA